MKNMKEHELNEVGKKVLSKFADASIKIAEEARGKCFFTFIYEPNFPIEVLKEKIKK